jgi:hypothetical protein
MPLGDPGLEALARVLGRLRGRDAHDIEAEAVGALGERGLQGRAGQKSKFS